MASVVGLVGLAVIVAVNTALAALLTRVFRVQLSTVWGSGLFVVLFVPLALLVSTLVLSGVVGLGGDLGSTVAVVGVTVALPLALGVAFDVFWMPAPEEVELPDTLREGPG